MLRFRGEFPPREGRVWDPACRATFAARSNSVILDPEMLGNECWYGWGCEGLLSLEGDGIGREKEVDASWSRCCAVGNGFPPRRRSIDLISVEPIVW